MPGTGVARSTMGGGEKGLRLGDVPIGVEVLEMERREMGEGAVEVTEVVRTVCMR